MENLDVLQSIIGLMMVWILLSIALGILVKVASIFFAILAFPTYLGLYFAEPMLSSMKIFSLNIPNKNPQKILMNLSASLTTISLMPLIGHIVKSFQGDKNQIDFMEEAIMQGVLDQEIYMALFLLSLIAIYVISYFFSEHDENNMWSKIENLSIPMLWKVVAKGVV